MLVFILDNPQPGTQQTAMHTPHWNLTTARTTHGCPHCLRRFYHARAVAGQKYHYPPCLLWLSLSLPLNVWVLKAFIAFAHLACPRGTTGRKYLMCWYSVVKVHPCYLVDTKDARRENVPLLPVSHFFSTFTTKNPKNFSVFWKLIVFFY